MGQRCGCPPLLKCVSLKRFAERESGEETRNSEVRTSRRSQGRKSCFRPVMCRWRRRCPSASVAKCSELFRQNAACCSTHLILRKKVKYVRCGGEHPAAGAGRCACFSPLACLLLALSLSLAHTRTHAHEVKGSYSCIFIRVWNTHECIYGKDSESQRNKSQQVIKISATLQDELTSLMLIK